MKCFDRKIYWYVITDVNEDCHTDNEPVKVGDIYGSSRRQLVTNVWDNVKDDLVWWTKQELLFISPKSASKKQVQQELKKFKKLYVLNNLPMRSCWKCNACHEHLKKDFEFLCFSCGIHYKNGRVIK